MDTDRIRLILEDGADRIKKDPGYAIKISAGVILCLTGFILFLVEAKRSDAVSKSNFVLSFPQRQEATVAKKGMHLPAVAICPTVSLKAAGNSGKGQISSVHCQATGYGKLKMPAISKKSVIVKKTDFENDALENFACWDVNADLKVIAISSSQTIVCNAFYEHLGGLEAAEASVTFYDPRKGSIENAPQADQFLWHSLHPTSLTSMYIEPKELVFLSGSVDWMHTPHFSQHHRYNWTEIVNSKGQKPGVSLSYGFQFLWFKQLREVNLYTSNQFWGVMGGLLYLLVGIYSILIAVLGAYGLDQRENNEYKSVNPSMPVIQSQNNNPYESTRPPVEPSSMPNNSGYGSI